MGNKAGDPHPKRFGKSAEQVNQEAHDRRIAEQRAKLPREPVEADDVAEHGEDNR